MRSALGIRPRCSATQSTRTVPMRGGPRAALGLHRLRHKAAAKKFAQQTQRVDSGIGDESPRIGYWESHVEVPAGSCAAVSSGLTIADE